MRFRPDFETRRYLELAAFAAILTAVLGLATVLDGPYQTFPAGRGAFESQRVEQELWFVLSVPLSAAAPLLALRRPWLAVLAALVLPLGSLVFGVSMFSAFVAALAAALVLLRSHVRAALVVAVLSLALPSVVPKGGSMAMPDGVTIYAFDDSPGRLATLMGLYAVAVALVLVAGFGFRTWVRGAAERADLAGERRRVDNESAALGERSRLARDLHDVVAHHVSLIAVRAETAPYTVDDLSPGARAALADIADDSRRALDELRGVLGVLQRGDDGRPDRAPQPGAADIAELVERARQTGTVEYGGQAALAVLDPARGYVAYRVLQEALTNARRHAPGERVDIACGATTGSVRVQVVNGGASESAVDPGRGLTGMRERVEAVGGTLDVRCREGRFEVEAVLPA